MASNKRTREPAFGRTDKGQIGPVMQQFGIWNVKKLPAGSALPSDMEFVTGKDRQYVAVEYSDNGVEQRAEVINQDGVIRCFYCGVHHELVTWCKHIYEVVVNRRDNPLFAAPGRYLLPIVPTDGVYCPVHLEDVELGTTKNKSFYAVNFKLAPRDENGNTKDHPDDDDDVREFAEITIGYVPKSTVCIADLRTLVAHWLVGNMEDTRFFAPTTCQGANHDKIKREHSGFTNTFYESMYGLCLDCIQEQMKRLAEMDSQKKTYRADAPNF